MKFIFTTTFIFLTMFVNAQKPGSLQKPSKNETVPEGQAVIYGNFIQRLGFSSGGYPQEIRLINIETNELLTFRVKPTFTSAKEHMFCYVLKPGTYAIYYYWWTQSKWYGGKIYTEPIYKNIDSNDDLDKKLKSGQIKKADLEYYTFTVTENSLNYLGTWHFDTGLVTFSDDKQTLDAKFKAKYKKLDLMTAKTVLPN